MSDVDQQLRNLFQDKAATVGPPPPIPPDLRGVPSVRWWRRHRQWLLIPAAALVTGAVVIPVALVSQNATITPMSAQEADAWAKQVCNERPSGMSPGPEDIGDMKILASAVCRWENPENLKDTSVGLHGVTSLSPNEITMLQQLVAAATNDPPSCAMIDSSPAVEFYVYLRDSSGHDWRLLVPGQSCLGFELAGAQYQSSALAQWLNELREQTQASLEREFPSEVTDRAKALLGSRFVDLSVGVDHASYIIGVLNLRDGEIDELTTNLEDQVPLYFEPRTVPASATMELRNIVERAFANDNQGVRVIGSNPATGRVLVGVASAKISTTAQTVSDILPGPWSLIGTDDGSILVCQEHPDPSDPCVIVRAVGSIAELSN